MTEKRYLYYEEPNGEFPFPYIKRDDGKEIISLYECSELLNSLVDENEQLKKCNGELNKKYTKTIVDYNGLGCEYDELKEENEELKTELKRIEKENYMLDGKVNRLTEELAYCYEKLGW